MRCAIPESNSLQERVKRQLLARITRGHAAVMNVAAVIAKLAISCPYYYNQVFKRPRRLSASFSGSRFFAESSPHYIDVRISLPAGVAAKFGASQIDRSEISAGLLFG